MDFICIDLMPKSGQRNASGMCSLPIAMSIALQKCGRDTNHVISHYLSYPNCTVPLKHVTGKTRTLPLERYEPDAVPMNHEILASQLSGRNEHSFSRVP